MRDAQAALIARWMHVGFVHGVMNTDNMTISGETIDYGPCAYIDAYDPDAVFSSIDTHGRYAYGKQPLIARWNLGRLAKTLLPLINADMNRANQLAGDTVNAFADRYVARWLDGMRAKLGLVSSEDDDLDLANGFLSALKGQSADYTLAFRRLSLARPIRKFSRLVTNCGSSTCRRVQWLSPRKIPSTLYSNDLRRS